MKILLDNNMPKVLRELLPGHTVVHCHDLGWAGYSDPELIRAAEEDGYELLITNDKKILQQHRLPGRRAAVMIVDTNSRKRLREAHDRIAAAVQRCKPGSVERVLL